MPASRPSPPPRMELRPPSPARLVACGRVTRSICHSQEKPGTSFSSQQTVLVSFSSISGKPSLSSFSSSSLMRQRPTSMRLAHVRRRLVARDEPCLRRDDDRHDGAEERDGDHDLEQGEAAPLLSTAVPGFAERGRSCEAVDFRTPCPLAPTTAFVGRDDELRRAALDRHAPVSGETRSVSAWSSSVGGPDAKLDGGALGPAARPEVKVRAPRRARRSSWVVCTERKVIPRWSGLPPLPGSSSPKPTPRWGGSEAWGWAAP